MSVEQLIALTILRKDVEAGNINRAYGVLEDLSASTAHALRFRRSLVFMFEGYEAEPRELYEVPEIRAYFNDLAVAWPDRVPGRGVRVAQEVIDSGIVGMPIRRSRRTG